MSVGFSSQVRENEQKDKEQKTVVPNMDPTVIRGFGDEWTRFDQRSLTGHEYQAAFLSYFQIFPWHLLPENSVGFDLGCGSGRWAREVLARVAVVHCIDPSEEALRVARRNLSDHAGVRFHLASVDTIPLLDNSMDFGYSLGVLHHVPDTRKALSFAVRKLKPGAPFLLYLYYAFDNRPTWFRLLHKCSEIARWAISRSPMPVRYLLSQIIAALIYFPFARISRMLASCGVGVAGFPLSFYKDRSFYTMRTDALDRFGTRLEQRFSKSEIRGMMVAAGLDEIVFSDRPPFWCAVGIRS